MIKFGPVGIFSSNGQTYDHWDYNGRGEISHIYLTADDIGIHMIQFQYIEDGKHVLTSPYGATWDQYHSGGYFLSNHTIELDHPNEYLTGINGRVSTYIGSASPTIKTLGFTTNLKEYGPFGRTSCSISRVDPVKPFRFELGKSRQFGGFYGSYNKYGLHGIGVYLRPKASSVKVEKT
ncbi:PREDICTED: inactive protein RESTRICTED TEV MOVEMENT 1-like [Tarenaya hassleriana]|uniref:inactive protein RESTRICTED TEV MOVEMENT 1-like n=1 Tax=Tarenaya hassleriana TaxID=28532 RepID=UPI00053C52C4|nr:PREDICTED: inactive protein RESTRICTED TEV MOVEMENT 1-like [Tarenaya hassleriana]